MIKRTSLFIFLMVGLIACRKLIGGDCSGTENIKPFFDITGIKTNTYKHSPGAITADSLTNMEEVSAGNFLILVEHQVFFYSQRKNNPGGLGDLMACSPLSNGYAGTKEKFDSIVITSKYDYNNSLPAGSNLISLFEYHYLYNTALNFPMSSFPGSLKQPIEMYYFMRLKSTPPLNALQQFTVKYFLSNGEQYSSTTKEVLIK